MSRFIPFAWVFTCLAAPCAATFGQFNDDYNQAEFAARPAPHWVQALNQGELQPELKDYFSPRGIQVEIVAHEPAVVNPAGLVFDDDGTLHVLEWKSDTAPDVLKSLHDLDGDGIYDESRVVMNDLELHGGLLFYDGWIYWASGGKVLRRRPHDAELLQTLNAAAEAKKGPPTEGTAGDKWIEQQLVSGLAAVVPFQANGLTLGLDGWLYVTAGSGDNRAESWDGSRALVLRTGGVFRMKPDGSHLHEFARGLRNPAGNVASDEVGNLFHLDGGLEDGGKFAGVRLLHLLEGADYGWRRRPSAAGQDADSATSGQPDLARAAAWGERPGKLPGMFKTGSGSPSGLMVLSSTQFPPFCHGLLIYPDPNRQLVRAYGIERSGETFHVVTQFDLLRSADPLFRPRQAIQGPDGAVYIADWRTNAKRTEQPWGDGKHGRIYRLSWRGTADQPEMPLAPIDTWKQIVDASEDTLAALISHEDFELRRRAAAELVRRARIDPAKAPAIAARTTTIAYDDSRPPPVRAAALGVSAQLMDATAFEALVLMLSHEDAEIQRLAADALGDHPPREAEARDRLVQAIQYHLFAPKSGVPRSMFLAHGKLAGKLETSEWAFEAASVTIRKDMGPQIFDAHVRALEMTKDAARDLMLGNLDVAVNFADADAKERQRMKEFVTATAEAMRTRELAIFLDALFRGEEDLAAKLEPPFQARLIATYRNVQVEPPIRADAVAEWLEKHPGRPFEVELAALETLSLVGTTKPEATIKLAQRLLAKPEQAKEIGRRLIAGQIGPGLQSEIVAALKKHGEGDLTGEFAALFKAIEKDLPSLSP